MSDIEYGRCDVCKIQNQLIRTYYHFPIKCECCGPTHFESVSHCADCEPTMPKATSILVYTQKLLDPIHEGLFKKVRE